MRNVIVTGASRGLGLGIAEHLAATGFNVLAIARKPSSGLSELIARFPGKLHFSPFDLTETAAMPQLVKNLRRGHGPLYGLVNNAGQSLSGMLANSNDAAIAALFHMNCISPVILSKYAARSMMTGEGGRIVNIASIVGATGYSGLSVYGATKTALTGFTRSLARELGPLGITVNAVAPGFVDTEMTSELNPGQRDQIARRSALKRMVEVQDVAGATAFLMSDAARNVTGTVLTVDAGNTA